MQDLSSMTVWVYLSEIHLQMSMRTISHNYDITEDFEASVRCITGKEYSDAIMFYGNYIQYHACF